MTIRVWLQSALTALITALGSVPTPLFAESSTQLVARQFREYCLDDSTDRGRRLLDDSEIPKASPDDAPAMLAALRDDGSWPDIDYASNARSAWPASLHLIRTHAITVHARRSDTPPIQAQTAIAAIHRAISYWKQHDLKCPNWWYNEIGVPKIIGDVALLLDADLTADEKSYICDVVLARSKVGTMTGQNRVWLAANGVRRAAITENIDLMKTAAAVIQEELRAGSGEGIQADWSFHQHGAQQQFGNYGMAYAVEMSRWANVLRGTPWAFPQDRLLLLRNFLLEGENWTCWRGVMDISACGRQLFPDSPFSKAGVIRGAMKTLTKADPDRADAYRAFVLRNGPAASNDLVGTRYFWNSDYLIHRDKDWMTSLRMSSSRTIGGETVNNENLSGMRLADGATFFYRNGTEYTDIFPMWDWRMIPGTTSQLDNASLRWPAKSVAEGTHFVGGASDGSSGCAAMEFRRDELRAKKAWFYAGGTVVCLGAGISSASPHAVVTTMNQSLLHGDVMVSSNSGNEKVADRRQLRDVKWVEHDGLRYKSLDHDNFEIDVASVNGDWKRVFDTPATPTERPSGRLFKLWIDHGKIPDSASYAYSVSLADTKNDAAITVLRNDTMLQAVKFSEAGSTQVHAVFWNPGRYNLDGVSIATDAPCVILLNSGSITVSDPTQLFSTLRLEINSRKIDVALPKLSESGRSATIAR